MWDFELARYWCESTVRPTYRCESSVRSITDVRVRFGPVRDTYRCESCMWEFTAAVQSHYRCESSQFAFLNSHICKLELWTLTSAMIAPGVPHRSAFWTLTSVSLNSELSHLIFVLLPQLSHMQTWTLNSHMSGVQMWEFRVHLEFLTVRLPHSSTTTHSDDPQRLYTTALA